MYNGSNVLDVENLSTRSKNKLDRFEKQEQRVTEHHQKAVKLLTDLWKDFEGKNKKAISLYQHICKAKQQDKHYLLNVNETAAWALVGPKIKEKEDKLLAENKLYEDKLKEVRLEKDQFIATLIKSQVREASGKAEFDTSSEEEDEEEKTFINNQDLELEEYKEKLRQEIEYLTNKVQVLGELHVRYLKERNLHSKDSYEYYLWNRRKSKVDQVRRNCDKRLTHRERLFYDNQVISFNFDDLEVSDGGYSDLEEFQDEDGLLENKKKNSFNRIPKYTQEEFEEERQREVQRHNLVLDRKEKNSNLGVNLKKI